MSEPIENRPTGSDYTTGEFVERYFKRNFFLGVLNGVLFNFAWAFTSGSTILPWFVSKLSNSNVLIGLASTLENLGWFMPQLLVAVITTHHKKQLPLYTKSAYLRAFAFCLLTLSVFLLDDKNPTLLLLSFFVLFSVYAFGGGLAGVSFTDIVAKIIPVNKRGSFFGMRMFFGGTLAALGGLLVKKILDSYHFPINFGIIFTIATILILFALFSFCGVKEPEANSYREKKSFKENFLKGMKVFKENKSFRQLLWARVFVGSYLLGLPFYVIFARKVLGVSPGAVGVFLTCEMTGYVLSNLLWGYLSNNVSNRLVILLSSFCSIVPPLVLLLNILITLPVKLFCLIFFFLGSTNAGLSLGATNYLLELAPEEDRPIYIGFMHTSVGPTVFLSVIGGLILQLTSFPFLYILVLLIAILGIYYSCQLTECQIKT
jgi:MFS family permease